MGTAPISSVSTYYLSKTCLPSASPRPTAVGLQELCPKRTVVPVMWYSASACHPHAGKISSSLPPPPSPTARGFLSAKRVCIGAPGAKSRPEWWPKIFSKRGSLQNACPGQGSSSRGQGPSSSSRTIRLSLRRRSLLPARSVKSLPSFPRRPNEACHREGGELMAVALVEGRLPVSQTGVSGCALRA